MKINIIKYALIALTVVLFGAFYLTYTSSSWIFSGTTEGVLYTGMVCHKVTRAGGAVEDYGCDKNVLTNVGKNHTTSQLFSEPTAVSATDIVDSMVLGNTSAPQDTDTSHPGKVSDCGLAEYSSLSWSSTGTSDGNVTANHQWTSSCNNVVVNTTGLETNGDTYFAGNSFTSVTLQANDQLTVTWYVWIT